EVLSVTFGGSTQFNANLAGNASVRYQQADYSNGRQDDFMFFSVSSPYAFNQHISGVLAYSFQDNDSNTHGASFTANVISLSAVFRYYALSDGLPLRVNGRRFASSSVFLSSFLPLCAKPPSY